MWDIEMYDEMYVRFVYVYFKSDGCYYDLQIVVLKFFLYIGVNSVFQFCMIGCCVNVVIL